MLIPQCPDILLVSYSTGQWPTFAMTSQYNVSQKISPQGYTSVSAISRWAGFGLREQMKIRTHFVTFKIVCNNQNT